MSKWIRFFYSIRITFTFSCPCWSYPGYGSLCPNISCFLCWMFVAIHISVLNYIMIIFQGSSFSLTLFWKQTELNIIRLSTTDLGRRQFSISKTVRPFVFLKKLRGKVIWFSSSGSHLEFTYIFTSVLDSIQFNCCDIWQHNAYSRNQPVVT